MTAKRPFDRAADSLRTVTLETGVNRYAEGSCLVAFGHTRVLVTASVEERVPPFLRGRGQGWVTAEYGMLPRATHTRGRREASEGKQSGRTQEIQRLIGRSLRAVVVPTEYVFEDDSCDNTVGSRCPSARLRIPMWPLHRSSGALE